MFYYKGTFTSVDSSGNAEPGVYSIYQGALSTFLTGLHQQEAEFNVGLDNIAYDWTFEILRFQVGCDNCGLPVIKIYGWR